MTFLNQLKQRLSEVQSARLDAEKRSLKELEKEIVGQEVVHVTTKMIEVNVDEDTKVARVSKCAVCSSNANGCCEHSKCFINVITLIPMFECPEGKW